MLENLLPNKATRRRTASATPSPAAARLAALRDEQATVTRTLADVATALEAAYGQADDEAIARLRAQRDELWRRRAMLEEDEAAAVKAVARLEHSDAETALAADLANLRRRFESHAATLERAARELAEAWRVYEQLHDERARLAEQCRQHERRYGGGPAIFSPTAVMNLPTTILPPMRQLAEAVPRIDEAREQVRLVEAGEALYPGDGQVYGLPVGTPAKRYWHPSLERAPGGLACSIRMTGEEPPPQPERPRNLWRWRAA